MKKIYTVLFALCFTACAIAQGDTYVGQIDALYDKAYQHLYKNKDSTSHYFNKIVAKSIAAEDWLNVFDALISENRNAGYYYDLKVLEKNLVLLDSLSIAKKDFLNSLPEKNLYINSILYDKGNYLFKLNNFRDARKEFQKIITNVEEMPDESVDSDQVYLLSTAYSFMAKMYQDEGKFTLAKRLYTKDIRYLERKRPNDLEQINKRYSLLASVYGEEKDYETSNRLFKSVLDQISKENIGNNSYLTACNNIAQNYIFLKQVDSASYYLSIMFENMTEASPFRSGFHSVRAEIFELDNNYDKALQDLKKVLSIEKQKNHKGKNLSIAQTNLKLGKLHRKFGHFDKAIDEFKRGSEILTTSSSTLDRFSLLEILANLSDAFTHKENDNDYSKAVLTTQYGMSILDSLKPSFANGSDKLRLIENAFPMFESGIEGAYYLFKSTGNRSYIDQAFEFAEKSKSVILLEALLSAKALQFANVPDTLLERELQLKSEITYLEKQLSQAKAGDNEREDQLFVLQEEHRQLIDKIETNYKAYYDLKYNTETLSLAETQKLISPDEKLISYFYGYDAIYGISIDKGSKQIERISVDTALERRIREVHRMLGNSNSDVAVLAKSSYILYTNLLAPFTSSAKEKKIIIIPDGLLNYIPFGALNTKGNGISYLMEKYAVSYVNSVTLYDQLMARGKKEVQLLAFAPTFEGEQVQIDPNRDNLAPLPHNKREVEQILTSFTGQSYIGQNASLQNFTSHLSNFGILHLATHAVFDDTSPEYSYLAFTNTDSEENLLYVSDLYNLQIDANLVTLSACESGVGELKRGEGFLSLARGFFFSGASSISSTLWKINDASTTILMNSFYKNLSYGDKKDLALQKAQLSFLDVNRQNGLSHPYYWSGFIISGNTAPLDTNTYWNWIIIGIALSTFVGFLVLRKMKKT
jgi:CHAT domain-containing protein